MSRKEGERTVFNVAIIGGGYIGRVHAKVISGYFPKLKIIAVAEKNLQKGKDFCNDFGGRLYSDIKELLKHENVDVVVICTPTYLHSEMVQVAASAKKNIFCEKPIVVNLNEAEQMIEIVKTKRVKSMVAHVLRFWPEYKKTKDIIDSGILGESYYCYLERICTYPNWTENNWNSNESLGGGAAIDLQIHDLDFISWIYGKPQLINADGVYQPSLGGWVHMSTNLKFEKNRTGHVEVGWMYSGRFPFTTVIRILGEKGSLEWTFRAGKNIEERGIISPIRIYWKDGKIDEIFADQIDPFISEWDYFIDCLEKNKEVDIATMEDGRNALQLVIASIQSAKQGKEVRL